MIPLAHITQWSANAPWPDMRQVEQDLIICRAMCDLFNHPQLKGRIAFRGGTAINKLLFEKPLRYSEDIDLVQVQPGPIGEIIDGVRDALSWLGKCNRDQAPHTTHLVFRFQPEVSDGKPLKLKLEINTREHQNLYGLKVYPFELASDWHTAATQIVSFEPEELFGTKLRALLQRSKNRDLFDLNEGLLHLGLDGLKVIECFTFYLGFEECPISRANAEERMLKKLNHSLIEDIASLLPPGVVFDDASAIAAFGRIWGELIVRIPGDPWKSTDGVINAIRKSQIPALLAGVHK